VQEYEKGGAEGEIARLMWVQGVLGFGKDRKNRVNRVPTTGSVATEILCILHRKFHVRYIEIPCILFGNG
jgi:hypothetical protein